MTRRDWVCVGVFLAIFFAAFGAAAVRRTLSFDEIFTAYLAKLPSASVLMRALWAGADLAPPLFHLITRALARLPIDPQLALRMPGLLGFGTMCGCAFVFVRRRCGTACAVASMLAPVAAGGTRYAIEARPYGLVLGCFGAAMICWQAAAEGRRRRAALVGLAVAIAAAVSLHYYAVLVLVPIGAGEIVRVLRERRVDWGVWGATAAGVLALPAHLPLIRLSRPYMNNAWAAPTASDLVACFGLVVSPLLLVCFLPLRRKAMAPEGSIPAREWAGAAALAMLPLIVYMVAATVTGIFVPRYALAAAMGFAILLGFALGRWRRAKPVAAVMLLAAVCVGAALHRIVVLTPPRVDIGAVLERGLGKGPIVSGNGFRFLHLNYYVPSAGVIYLADPAEARRRTGSDSVDLGLLALRPWGPVRVEGYEEFVRGRRPFLLYWVPEAFSWVLPKLREDGARLRVVAEGAQEQLYQVEWE